jgi:hypothetical protein
MYSGRFFRSADGPLATFVRELDESIASTFPEFVDGSAAARVVLRPDQLTGQGVALADGVRFRRPTAVGLYFGDIAESGPVGDFVLVLPQCRRTSGAACARTTRPLTRSGSAVCRSPPPLNVAMYNHTCHDATARVRSVRVGSCALPCVVAYALPDLPNGSRLVWDYDGGLSSGAFSVGPHERAALQASGVTFVPCACRGVLPCPRSRWFRVFPPP